MENSGWRLRFGTPQFRVVVHMLRMPKLLWGAKGTSRRERSPENKQPPSTRRRRARAVGCPKPRAGIYQMELKVSSDKRYKHAYLWWSECRYGELSSGRVGAEVWF